ncbi:hypothetical protein E4U26_004507 [Claviceps purpurea]|nr:hypothetical protein E4U11_006616 [Claviceps purpurea]KAG6223511.1 hypothetical protein E4U26_004507 [Claviceps purpurea]
MTMRLYLLPLSTRRSLLYAQRLHHATAPTDTSYFDRGAAWAERTWSNWEKKESGWQKKVVEYGNHAFRRIPYEEWGLKSVPLLSSREQLRRHNAEKGEEQTPEQNQDHVDLVFPRSVMSEAQAEDAVRRMGSERDGLHRRRMLWCIVGMPITIPFALVPIIPNLPFFYLVYRAWSHWRAIAGAKHIQFLVSKKLLRPTASPVLDALYSQGGAQQKTQTPTSSDPSSSSSSPTSQETLLLSQAQVRSFSEKLDVPALEIELERAIWQVEQAIGKEIREEGLKPPGAEKEKES